MSAGVDNDINTFLTGLLIDSIVILGIDVQFAGRIRRDSCWEWRLWDERNTPDCVEPRKMFDMWSVVIWAMGSLNCKSELVGVRGQLRDNHTTRLFMLIPMYLERHALADNRSSCKMEQPLAQSGYCERSYIVMSTRHSSLHEAMFLSFLISYFLSVSGSSVT